MSQRLLGAAAASLLLLAFGPNFSPGQENETSPRTRGAFLGIAVEPATEGATQEGVTVREVTPNSPAAKAGLKPGDVITQVGKKEIRDFEELANQVSQHKAGEKLTLQVSRGDQKRQMTVTLGQRPRSRPQEDEERAPQNYYGRRRPTAILGVQTEELTPDVRKREGLSAQQGAFVAEVYPNTPADEAGVQEGDVITKVNDQAITNPEELRDAIQKAGPGHEVTIDVTRGKRHRQLSAHLEESPVELGPNYGLFPGEANREIQRLRQRVQQLEQRIRKLEQNRPNESSKERF